LLEKEGKQKCGIDKFFNQNLNKNYTYKNNDQIEDMTSCEKCGKYMLVWELKKYISHKPLILIRLIIS
jgi:hypothetical protein